MRHENRPHVLLLDKICFLLKNAVNYGEICQESKESKAVADIIISYFGEMKAKIFL